jgi:hypothetical protein
LSGRGKALAGPLLLLPGLLAAAEPAPPAWHGVWSGRIGTYPVQACFDGSTDWRRGSYYYRSTLRPIGLQWHDDTREWAESEDDPTKAATIKLDKVGTGRIEGRWIKGKTMLPVLLDRVPTETDPEDNGPCGSAEYSAPRMTPTRVSETRATFDGRAYRKLALVVGRQFENVSVETFAIDGGGAAAAKINRILREPIAGAPAKSGWIECMQGSLGANGIDGEYAEGIEPKMIGRRWMAVNHHVDGFCGGAHPFAGNSSRLFDLARGAEVRIVTWFNRQGITITKYDGIEEPAGTITPALRDAVLGKWKADDEQCDDPVRTSDFWDIRLSRAGFVFTPSLPHVAMACGEEFVLPFVRAARFLAPAGKAGLAELR